jgi:hypothetical protein
MILFYFDSMEYLLVYHSSKSTVYFDAGITPLRQNILGDMVKSFGVPKTSSDI